MVRGLYTAYTGLVNQQKRLDIVSNNLANSTTTGYKKEGMTTQSFDSVYGIKVKDETVGYMNQNIGKMSLGVKIGSAYPRPEVVTMNVRGRNLVTGLPKTVEVTSEETEEALREATSQIVEAVHSVLEKTPPELASDIADRGIVLTGGGSLLSGLEDLIESKTGINTMTAEDPMTAVAIGTGKFIEFLSGYREE